MIIREGKDKEQTRISVIRCDECTVYTELKKALAKIGMKETKERQKIKLYVKTF